jgi:hypothetical protein
MSTRAYIAKYWLVFSVNVMVIFTASSVSARQVVTLLVGDTKDSAIGKGVENNIDWFENWLHVAHDTSQIPISVNKIMGDGFSCQILSKLKNITVGPDDTLIFYDSGHGERDRAGAPSAFPEFACHESPFIRFATVVGILEPMKPRLLLVLADAWNSFPGQAVPQLSLPQISAKADTFKHLLLDYSGEILASSSSPGQFSWYTSAGGLFTQQLADSLNAEMVRGALSSWQRIIIAATKLIGVGHAKEGDLVVQQPQFETYYLTAPQ